MQSKNADVFPVSPMCARRFMRWSLRYTSRKPTSKQGPLIVSHKIFDSVCHFNATLVCHSISSAFVAAEWRLYLCFCLSGTERKCTSYRYSLQAISNHLPFWWPNCRPTGAHTLQGSDFHPTDLRSIPIADKRFSCTRICSDPFEGQTEYYHDGHRRCSRQWSSWGVNLTNHLHLVAKLRMHGAIPPFSLCLYGVVLRTPQK
jgi:hypothetical protein